MLTPARAAVRVARAAVAASLLLTVAAALLAPPSTSSATARDAVTTPPPAPVTFCRLLDGAPPVCVPAASPDGAPTVAVGEDGSAGYADGWALDPDGPDGGGSPAWVAPGHGFRVECPPGCNR